MFVHKMLNYLNYTQSFT